jgi:hypothetical protein
MQLRAPLGAGVFDDSLFETGQLDAGDWQAGARLYVLILDDHKLNRSVVFGVVGRYEGPFLLLAEFTQAWVTSSAKGEPPIFGCDPENGNG